MATKFKRIILTVKDIQIITGKGYKSAYLTMRNLRDCLGKQKNQNVTIKEYADYNGINIDEILNVIE